MLFFCRYQSFLNLIFPQRHLLIAADYPWRLVTVNSSNRNQLLPIWPDTPYDQLLIKHWLTLFQKWTGCNSESPGFDNWCSQFGQLFKTWYIQIHNIFEDAWRWKSPFTHFIISMLLLREWINGPIKNYFF